MRRRRFNQSPKKIHWVTWLVIAIACIFLVCAISLFVLYSQILKGKDAGLASAGKKAVKQTELVQADHVELFSGKDSYYVVYGKTKKKEAKIAFMPKNAKAKPKVISEKDILTKDEIQSLWRQKCSACELTGIAPGMIDNKPIWEVSYQADGQYVFDYMSMYDGSRIDRFRLSSLYQ